jgi:hypothetical protein
MKKMILSALVDNPHEVIFGRSCIGQHSIDFSEDQRGFISTVPETHRESLRHAFHDSSSVALVIVVAVTFYSARGGPMPNTQNSTRITMTPTASTHQ